MLRLKVNALMHVQERAKRADLGLHDPSPLLPLCSSIKVVPVGASRGMKKLLQEKFPNMSRLQDISELLAM